MAVTEVIEVHGGRDGDIALNGEWKVTRSYIVVTNSKRDGQITVCSAAGLPTLGSAYNNGSESSSPMILRSKKAKQKKESPFVWEVDCEYTPITIAGEGDSATTGDVTLIPTKYTWRTIQETADVLVDTVPQKVQNAAGDPFLDPVTAEKSYFQLIIERNEDSFDGIAMSEYINTLNSEPFFGFDAKTCRMVAIDATGEYDVVYGGFWTVTYEVHIRKPADWKPYITIGRELPVDSEQGPWDRIVRNIGNRERLTIGDPPTPVIERGHVVTDGVDLDDDGVKLADGEEPYYWIFKPYASKSWTPLDIQP
jgi:hypothetical protein